MDIKEFAAKLFEKGKSRGFSEMEVYFTDSEAFEINSFNQDIDSYSVNTQSGLSFRGINEGKMGYSFTEKFEDEDIDFLIENAKQNSEEIQGDTDAVIYEGSKEYSKLDGIQLKDEEVSVKIQDALDMEKSALNKDERIDSVQYCLVETGKNHRRLLNTKGLDLEEESGHALAYLSVVAKTGEDVKSASKFKITSDYNDLDFDKLVEESIEESISMLGAKIPDTGKYRIILRNDAAASLLATFSSVFSADSVQKGLSLLKGKVGQRIASDAVTLVDDPFHKGAPGCCSFDDEGVATCLKTIIGSGELKTYLHNLKTAHKAGTVPTGNGFKQSYKSPVDIAPTNMLINPGTRTLGDAVKTEKRAIIITDLQGLHSGANAVSGDFSLAALGYLVEDGRITAPIEQITVSGNFYDMLMDIEELLSDLEFGMPSHAGCCGSPSLIIKEMSVSGK